MRGTRKAIDAQMAAEIQRAYSTLLTRVVRDPTHLPLEELPHWICVPDFPVGKNKKVPLGAVTVNGGRHWHGLCLIPMLNRLRRGFEFEVERQQKLLTREPYSLYRFHAKPVVSDPGYVVDYLFKMVRRHRVTLDEILILPQTQSERR